jgi:cathepsin F
MKFMKICLMLLFVSFIFAQKGGEQAPEPVTVTPESNADASQPEPEVVLGAGNGRADVQAVSLESNEAEEDESVLFAKYQLFMQKYGKRYTNLQELNERFINFSSNYQSLISYQNTNAEVLLGAAEPMKQEDALQLGITEFFDISDEEYERQYLTLNIPKEELRLAQTPAMGNFQTSNESEADSARHLQSIPSAYDWRSKGVVTSVKDQGQCGSCYTFAVAANLESQYAIKNKKLLDLSEQQMVNCSKLDYGCNGGMMANTFKYLMGTSTGLGLETSLRYAGRKYTCTAIRGVVKVKSYKFAGSTNNSTIAAFLYKTGPLAIGLNASTFKYYKSGILGHSSGCAGAINHAVTLVGYGVSSGVRYWIIKNSWNAKWGEKGYIRLAWGACGANTYVLTGILA